MNSEGAVRRLGLVHRFSWLEGRERHLIWLALGLAALLVLLQLAREDVYYDVFAQDVFIHLNGISHIQSGGRPHVDFPTPIGAFYYYVFYATTWLAQPSAYTAVYANALVAALLAGLSLAIGHRRLPPAWAALLTLYVVLVALSPRHLGDTIITFNAAYNRWGWSFLALLAVLISLPRSDADRGRVQIMDGLLTGLIIAILFFTKLSYAAVGVGLLLSSLVSVRRDARPLLFVGVATGAALLAAVLVELSSGIVSAYITDLSRALQLQAGGRIAQLVSLAYFTGYEHVLALFVVGAAVLARGGDRPGLLRLGYYLVLIAAGLLVATQNHRAYEIPLLPVTALIGLRMFVGSGRTEPGAPAAALLAPAAALMLFLLPMVFDMQTMLRQSVTRHVPGPDVDWLKETPLHNLAYRAGANEVLDTGNCVDAAPTVDEDREYMAALRDGVRLLAERGADSRSRVLALMWTNPFPSLLRAAPVSHDLAWWDPGRSFSAAVHPNPDALLGGADYVMIPKFDWNSFSKTTTLMLEIYGPSLQRRFRRAGESACWLMLARV